MMQETQDPSGAANDPDREDPATGRARRTERVRIEDGRAPTEERRLDGFDGLVLLRYFAVALLAGLALLATSIRLTIAGSGSTGLRAGLWAGGLVLLAAAVTGFRGLTKVSPGDAVVVQVFGRYLGTLRRAGLHWVRPWARRSVISVRIRTRETSETKVNDSAGNPVQVSAVIVWRVADTAQAQFAVDNYQQFFSTQCDAAVRHVVASYPYDDHGDGSVSLSKSTAEITSRLTTEVIDRVRPAGVEVVESRFVSISYAPEIASAMLRRQQAAAIVAARQQIVDGAVGMVEMALHRLDEENVVDLDEERKAAMVSNLLVVLCSDHPTQPIVNAGSLYH